MGGAEILAGDSEVSRGVKFFPILGARKLIQAALDSDPFFLAKSLRMAVLINSRLIFRTFFDII